jgi:hypothetical protein
MFIRKFLNHQKVNYILQVSMSDGRVIYCEDLIRSSPRTRLSTLATRFNFLEYLRDNRRRKTEFRMTDIPPDFDPSVLFSDYLPSTQPEEYPTLPSPPAESYSDELEAIDLVIEETRQRHNKEGVVIRHKQLNPKPAFRSSSLPPRELIVTFCFVFIFKILLLHDWALDGCIVT